MAALTPHALSKHRTPENGFHHDMLIPKTQNYRSFHTNYLSPPMSPPPPPLPDMVESEEFRYEAFIRDNKLSVVCTSKP